MNSSYQQSQCAKIQQNDVQTFCSYSSIPMNSTLSPTTTFIDIYNNIPTQNISQNQQTNNLPITNVYQEPGDFLVWENRILPEVEKALKVPEKMEMIEISSKDLSPASYCSNVDLLLSDYYKLSGKELNCFNKYDNQWDYNQIACSQKNILYPSCAQEKPYKLSTNHTIQNLDSAIKNNTSNTDILFETTTNYNSVINPNEQQMEGSNDESDIIVEETDEEITDYSEDQEKRVNYHTNKCIICNIIYTPLGTQFYLLTSENPLTMSSKLTESKNYLCGECLGLINTIDHLQLKLDNFYSELKTKFAKSCSINGVKYKKKRVRIRNVIKKILCLKKYCYYHLMKHRNPGYLCELCGKTCSNKQSAKTSIAIKNLRQLTKLKNHIKLKHDKKFIAICSICNIGFIKVSDYKSHMVSHSTDKKYPCTECGKSYKTVISVIKKFVSQKSLDSHLKYHEGRVKKNNCNICGKTFTSGFEEHLRVHNNLREFECEHCDMKFNTKGSLSKHVKKKHGANSAEPEKNYKFITIIFLELFLGDFLKKNSVIMVGDTFTDIKSNISRLLLFFRLFTASNTSYVVTGLRKKLTWVEVMILSIQPVLLVNSLIVISSPNEFIRYTNSRKVFDDLSKWILKSPAIIILLYLSLTHDLYTVITIVLISINSTPENSALNSLQKILKSIFLYETWFSDECCNASTFVKSSTVQILYVELFHSARQITTHMLPQEHICTHIVVKTTKHYDFLLNEHHSMTTSGTRAVWGVSKNGQNVNFDKASPSIKLNLLSNINKNASIVVKTTKHDDFLLKEYHSMTTSGTRAVWGGYFLPSFFLLYGRPIDLGNDKIVIGLVMQIPHQISIVVLYWPTSIPLLSAGVVHTSLIF
ncbi:hypothetical protein NQ317_019276 [Molorchus minor]|uniref:C2H2-type domain-containing protein n=1 Tax=Molorchus minor TaxID=1323400 RepID=A0ABQ9JYT9_9CUCU|nr:hypothetical protein NQ317_019276 [Molorchus minor]